MYIVKRIASHCNALQRATTHCNTLQHTATHYNTLQHTATHCNTVHILNTHSLFTSNSAGNLHMGWLRLVGSLKLQVSFAKEPYKRDDILQKRPIILRSLLIVATPYACMRVFVCVWHRDQAKFRREESCAVVVGSAPIRECACIHEYKCMNVYMRINSFICECMYVCMSEYKCMFMCSHVWMYVGLHVCKHVCCMNVNQSIYTCMCACMYVCMSVCMCICNEFMCLCMVMSCTCICMLHTWISHVTQMNVRSGRGVGFHSWVCMSHVTHMNTHCDLWGRLPFVSMHESCHTYEQALRHTWMSHVTHVHESCHTHEWVISHIWMCAVIVGSAPFR